jgi:hypothetical protein
MDSSNSVRPGLEIVCRDVVQFDGVHQIGLEIDRLGDRLPVAASFGRPAARLLHCWPSW